jgi:hypothetical protein
MSPDPIDYTDYSRLLRAMRNPALAIIDRATAAVEASAYEDLVNEQINTSDKIVYLHPGRMAAQHINHTRIAKDAREWLLRDSGVEVLRCITM